MAPRAAVSPEMSDMADKGEALRPAREPDEPQVAGQIQGSCIMLMVYQGSPLALWRRSS